MMKVVSIISVVLLLAANLLALVPASGKFGPYLPGVTLVFGLIALGAILADRRSKVEPRPPAAEAVRPVAAATQTSRAEVEIASLLAILQEKGRLVDFLMDDINAYDDAQVGAAARVVHDGCKAVLQEYFRIRPVRQESEGSTVQVAPGYTADEYRLLGRISGQAPFSGVLVHRGWKAEAVKLPRVLHTSSDRLPTIAPAEVELK
jgi:hypothetical protein